MRKILSQILGALLGIWLTVMFIPGIELKVFSDSNFFGIPLTAQWQMILLLGIILGLLNFFVRPVLMAITLPLRIITLGIFGVIINLAMLWIIDAAFQELTAPWFWPLFETSLLISILSIIIQKILVKDDKK